MFLKRLKLTNYRKFSAEQNVVEFNRMAKAVLVKGNNKEPKELL